MKKQKLQKLQKMQADERTTTNSSTRECLICLEDKYLDSFPSTTVSSSEVACRHLEKTCKECLGALRKPQCPYCQQDWRSLYPPVSKMELPLIYKTIYTWIAIAENDVALIEHLIHFWKIDFSENMPFDYVSQLLTGRNDLDSQQAMTFWNENPERSIMKKSFLLCQGIQFENNQYVYVHP